MSKEDIIDLITKYRNYSLEKTKVYRNNLNTLEFMLETAKLSVYQELLDNIKDE